MLVYTPEQQQLLDEHKDYRYLPYVPLTPDQKQITEVIQRKGNPLLWQVWRQVCEKDKIGKSSFRGQFFKAIDAHKSGVFQFMGVEVDEQTLGYIKDVRNIEKFLLYGYSRVIAQYAHKWKGKSPLTFLDLYSEGTLALLKAIYLFGTKSKADGNHAYFQTYATCLIFTRVQTAVVRSMPSTDLLRRYEEMRLSFNGPVSLDECCIKMKLNSNQVRQLFQMLVQVYNSSSIQTNTDDDTELNDYSQLSVNANGIGHTKFEIAGRCQHSPVYRSTDLFEPDMLTAVKQTELTDWEQTVLDAFLKGGHGWQTEVAKSMINPLTGKEYSRRAPAVAMESIKNKILATYEKNQQKNKKVA